MCLTPWVDVEHHYLKRARNLAPAHNSQVEFWARLPNSMQQPSSGCTWELPAVSASALQGRGAAIHEPYEATAASP